MIMDREKDLDRYQDVSRNRTYGSATARDHREVSSKLGSSGLLYQVDALKKQLVVLHESIDRLTSRVEPVLEQTADDANTLSSPPVSVASSVMGRNLEAAIRDVDGAVGRIEELLTRLRI
jgi:hypothetical protein